MASQIKLNNANGKQTIISSGDSLQDITLDGSKLLKQIDTIADLRDLTETPSTVYVKAYDNSGNTEGAFGNHFFKHTGTDTDRLQDNGGTVIVSTNLINGAYQVYSLQYSGAVNIKWFGLREGVVTEQDTIFQKAIDYCSISGDTLLIPDGTFCFYNLVPKSNLTIIGNGDNSVLKQIQPSTEIFTGIKFEPSAGEVLENVHISNLKFDGGRVSAPAIGYNNLLFFRLYNGTVSNVTIDNCTFVECQNNAIMFASYNTAGTANNIKVSNCKMHGNDNGNGATTGGDLIRLEAVNYVDGNYGEIRFKDIIITDNYAEEIRTLGDVKRGCSNFIVSNNITKNMYDCHHSVDGSFNGQVSNNSCEVTLDFKDSSSTFTNFIEIQGESIIISNNSMKSAIDVSTPLIRDGIFITAYGHPDEPEISTFGHMSNNINIYGNNIENVNGTGIRIINSKNINVHTNIVKNATNFGIAIGTGGYTDELGNVYDSYGNSVVDNIGVNCGVVAFTDQTTNNYFANCLDENGFESISGTLGTSSSAYVNLNYNPLFRLDGAGANNIDLFSAAYYPEATEATTKPRDVPFAVVLNDETSASLRQHSLNNSISVKQNELVYFRYWKKYNTSSVSSILVQEYNEDAYISGHFYGGSNPVEWTEYEGVHKVISSSCTRLVFSICPATDYNTVTPTGLVEYANFRVSKTFIGV